MEYKILRQEAFASIFNLNADFEYKGKKYQVNCTYLNGDGLEDIEVFNEDDSCIENDFLQEKILEMGKEILEDMDIDKHFTQY
jgi:hypothetical protein